MTIKQRIDTIADDLVYNVTQMYERQDIVIAFLLTYFSPLEITFDGRDIRGWLDILLFGESRSGKSDSVRTLQKFFKRGGITREKVTYAGLVGGVDKNQYGYMAKPGIFSLNDRGAIVVDEMHNLPVEDFGRMSDVRSSGIAHIQAIVTIMNLARCRKIWIANPRINKERYDTVMFNSVPHPINLVRQLIVALEDMTRFDLMLGFKMTPDIIRQKYRTQTKPPHIFRKEKMRRMLEIAWSRTKKDIIFEKETTQEIYKISKKLNENYKSDFPMLIGAEQPDRIARLAAACASLIKIGTPSIENLKTVLVKPEHTEWVHNWLIHLFEENDLQYGVYAKSFKSKENQYSFNREKIIEKIRKIKNYKQILFTFNNSVFVSQQQLRTEAPGVDNTDTVLSGFYRAGLIKSVRSAYVKTELFIDLLNKELAEEVNDMDLDKISFGEKEEIVI